MVSVIISNYRGDKFLKNCIDSIKNQNYNNIEIIVVSDSKEAMDICENHGTSFYFTKNKGLASAYNHGAKFSNGEYLFFMNPDIILHENCISNLVIEIEKNNSIFSVDPLQYDKDNRIIHSKTILQKGKFFTTFIPWIKNIQIKTENVSEVPYTSAGAMLVRKNYFLELKGFDEDYFIEMEDVDICWRALLKDLKCIFVPNAKLRHFVGGCTENMRFKRAIEWNKGLLRFVTKVMPVNIILNTLLMQLLRIVVNIIKINFKRSIAISISILITLLKSFSILKSRKETLEHSRLSSSTILKYFTK